MWLKGGGDCGVVSYPVCGELPRYPTLQFQRYDSYGKSVWVCAFGTFAAIFAARLWLLVTVIWVAFLHRLVAYCHKSHQIAGVAMWFRRGLVVDHHRPPTRADAVSKLHAARVSLAKATKQQNIHFMSVIYSQPHYNASVLYINNISWKEEKLCIGSSACSMGAQLFFSLWRSQGGNQCSGTKINLWNICCHAAAVVCVWLQITTAGQQSGTVETWKSTTYTWNNRRPVSVKVGRNPCHQMVVRVHVWLSQHFLYAELVMLYV